MLHEHILQHYFSREAKTEKSRYASQKLVIQLLHKFFNETTHRYRIVSEGFGRVLAADYGDIVEFPGSRMRLVCLRVDLVGWELNGQRTASDMSGSYE